MVLWILLVQDRYEVAVAVQKAAVIEVEPWFYLRLSLRVSNNRDRGFVIPDMLKGHSLLPILPGIVPSIQPNSRAFKRCQAALSSVSSSCTYY
jgi:hypothetical protein